MLALRHMPLRPAPRKHVDAAVRAARASAIAHSRRGAQEIGHELLEVKVGECVEPSHPVILARRSDFRAHWAATAHDPPLHFRTPPE